jgi:ribosomal-protein-alanine N-acetyltransferase
MLNKIGTQEIETKRLLLRRMKISDSEDMYNNWASDPCVSKFYSWEPHKNIFETKQIIKKWVAQYDDPLCFHWIVIDKETQKAIGTFYISLIDEENCTGTINCILAQQVWGKGLATEITQSVISYCFKKVNFKKIFAHHHENNIGSGKALVKAGLHFTDKSYHTYEDNPSINGNYLHYVIENSNEK